MKVREVMTTTVVTAQPGEEIGAAARRMLELGVKSLPVTEDGRLVGIVSRHDLLRLFHRTDEDVAAEDEAKLASPLHAPEDHELKVSVEDRVVTLEGQVRGRRGGRARPGRARPGCCPGRRPREV